MIIVSVIVALVLLFNWLSHRSTNPEDLVRQLRSGNAASWQTALDVANLLTDHRRAELRQSPELADAIAKMLDELIERGKHGEADIDQRIYLCLALGTFEVEEGLDSLIRAAKTERNSDEVRVRTAAIESVARRINVQEQHADSIRQDKEIMDALVDASTRTDDDPDIELLCAKLRYTTAFVLGLIGTDQANDVLAPMLNDQAQTVRFNAATGMARSGDKRCMFRLLEMMDVDTELSLPSTKKPLSEREREMVRNEIRGSILINGVRATGELLKHSDIDRDVLVEAMKKLRNDPDISGSIKKAINEILR
jgi:HEAT repeat protein